MFKTYKDKLVEIEGYYNEKDYNATIVESAKLTEKALSAFFNQFHSFLTVKEDWNKYLEFEKQNGEKYANFLKKPTIGVAIGYYSQLLELFPNQFGLTQEIKRYLNQINQIRNSNVHASDGQASDEEAASILDSLEKILISTNLTKASVDVVGVPIKFYLVYKSIREKFEVSQSEEDFGKIVSDSKKILPELLSNFINKIYQDLPLKTKVELTELYNLTVEKKKDNTLAYYIKLCLSLDIANRIKQGQALKDSLEFINLDSKEAAINRRQTRHYVTALEIIIEHTDNPDTRYFLDFADAVKKKYLVKHTLADRDRIILEEKAQELNISKDLAVRIEESVIKTIEKELILFQTLTVDEPTAKTSEPKETTKKKQLSWYLIAGAAALLVVLIIVLWQLNTGSSGFTDYEKAHFAYDNKRVISLTKDSRPLNDIKANYYYLYSLNEETNKIPDETKIEYQKLLKANPNSPYANLYLGFIYNLDFKWTEEIDSSWVLIKNAEKLGLTGLELNLVKELFFSQAVLPESQLAMADELEKITHPRAKYVAARVFLDIRHDTVKARRLYNEAIKIYPNYSRPYLHLANLHTEKRQYDSARILLTKAREINSENPEVISALAKVYQEEGRLDSAKLIYRKFLEDLGKNDLRAHAEFGMLLLRQDSVMQGIRFVDSALTKFPKDRNLLLVRYRLLSRDNSLKQTDMRKLHAIAWNENFNDALNNAKAASKPLLLNLFDPTNFWCNFLDREIFTDSIIGGAINQFIPLKINRSSQMDISKKYQIKTFPALLLLDADGKKVFELTKFKNKEEFMADLQKGLQLFSLLQTAKDPTKHFTEVTNFEGAKIIAKTKNMPIMVLVGDDRSDYTKRIKNESFQHPLFKPASQNLVYLYLNNNSTDPLLKELAPKTFPTIFFLAPNGDVIHQVYGYLPGEELASLAEEVKESFTRGMLKLRPRVNWFYDAEEARSYSLVEKKNIFQYFHLASCGDCDRMEETFAAKEVVEALQNYVCLNININTKYGMEQYDGSRAYNLPFSFILNENGEELFGNGGYMGKAELIDFLEIKDKLRLAASMGFEKHKEFVSKNTLVKNFIRFQRFQSAISVSEELQEMAPDNGDIELDLADAYRKLNQGEKAIEAYKRAIEKGVKINDKIVKSVILSFIEANNLPGAIAWFEKQNSIKGVNKSYLILGKSYVYEYLGDSNNALSNAKEAIKLEKTNVEARIQYIKASIESKSYAEGLREIGAYEKELGENPLVLFYKSKIEQAKGEKDKANNSLTLARQKSNGFFSQLVDFELFQTFNFYSYPSVVQILEEGTKDAMEAFGSPNPTFLFVIAEANVLQNKSEEAYSYIKKAIDLEPNPAFKIDKGYIELLRKNNEQAATIIEEAAQQFPEEEFRAKDFLTLALNNIYLNKKEIAIGQLKKASSYRTGEFPALDTYYKEKAKSLLAQYRDKK